MFFQENGSHIWDTDEAKEYLDRQAQTLEFKMHFYLYKTHIHAYVPVSE